MNKKEIMIGLCIALIFGGILSMFASSWPDGLESIAEHKGFLALGEGQPLMSAPVADYAWPGVKSEKIATAVAGVFGTLVVFGFGYVVAFLLKRPKKFPKTA
ncbi:MAG: PDGLE domain-containing protein [Candidatus Omnitrophota bacterium]